MKTYSPSLVNLDGRLIESYQRETYATDQAKQQLGLDSEAPIISNVGVESIPEFVVLEGTNNGNSGVMTWSLSRVNQSVKIESVIVDSPNQDGVTIEVISRGGENFSLTLDRTQTPYGFPTYPLTPDMTIKAVVSPVVKKVKVVLKAVIILETLQPDPPSNQNLQQRPGR